MLLQPRSHSTPNNRVDRDRDRTTTTTPEGSPGKTVRMTEPVRRRVQPAQTVSVESTGESTLSLLSALNHESNENLSQFSTSDEEHDNMEISHNNITEHSSDDDVETADKATQAEQDSSPWQQWIQRKNSEKQKQMLEENEQSVKRLQSKHKKCLESKQHQDIVKINVNLWLQKKDLERLRNEQEEKHKQRSEKSKKEIEKMNINEKAKARYKQWLEKKQNQDKIVKEQTKQEEAENEERKKARRQSAEQKYDDWFRTAKNRPRTTPVSYGYTNGRLAGFYNWSTYPTPSYYNPVPWAETMTTTRSIDNKQRKNKKQQVTLSPPLLWKQREEKEKEGQLHTWR